ncbi:unnamed protein product, partial [Ectocarpus sp. 13 AM-2016]
VPGNGRVSPWRQQHQQHRNRLLASGRRRHLHSLPPACWCPPCSGSCASSSGRRRDGESASCHQRTGGARRHRGIRLPRSGCASTTTGGTLASPNTPPTWQPPTTSTLPARRDDSLPPLTSLRA